MNSHKNEKMKKLHKTTMSKTKTLRKQRVSGKVSRKEHANPEGDALKTEASQSIKSSEGFGSEVDAKVALVHDYLVQHGGGEKTLEAICEIFPNAPIYTSIYEPKKVKGIFNTKKVHTIGEKRNKLLTRFPILSKYFTFMLPLGFEKFDLSEYDIIISSSSSYAKGVLTTPDQLHVSYIHTPPRFLYGYSVESTKRNAWYYKPVVMVVDHFLKIWDYLAAQRPDYLIANSNNIKRRIKKFYGRTSKVIYPPVDVKYDAINKQGNLKKPYYVAIGRLAAYKNFDLIISGFNLLGYNLKIIGVGTEEKKLKKMAKENIKFLGRISDKEKHEILENALGLVFPVVDEDLGIVPIEALAHGVPVLAHKSGGPLETIRANKDGMFFKKLDIENFVNKLREFDNAVRENKFDEKSMKKQAAKFSKEIFKKELKAFVMEKWNARTTRNYNN